jgi:hypothetical protein
VPADGPLWLLEAERSLSPVQVLAREHAAAVLDQKRWSYLSTWWVFHEGSAELGFTLPAGARLTGFTIDGSEQTLPPGRDGEMIVPLPGEGARRVALRWFLPASSGELFSPSAEVPRLRGDAAITGVSVLHIPPGYRPSSSGGYQSGVAAASQAELERGAGQLRLAQALGESLGRRRRARGETAPLEAQLSAVLKCLDRYLWNAEQMLQALPGGAQEKETDRLKALREQSRTQLRQLPRDITPAAGLLASSEAADWSRTGLPLYRVDLRPPAAVASPGFSLTADDSLASRQALAATGLLVCFLLAVWTLSSFPGFVTLTRVFWPEQAVLLGLLGLQTFGPTFPVLFLLALGGIARVLSLASALMSFLHRRSGPEPQRA